MGTGLKFLFEEEVIMNQGTNLGSQVGRWIILAALVALLGALLLTMRPVGAQSTNDPPQLTIVPPATVEHNENDDGPVYTFRAIDPDGDQIFWTLSGTDVNDFEIESGALTFKNAPDFEMPTDRPHDEDGVGGISPAEEGEENNVYFVTVRFSDGGTAGSHALRVEVQDVEEAGMVLLSPRQPQVGTPLTALIIDLDGVVSDADGIPHAEYQWAKSDSMGGTPTDIDGATERSYTPTEDDEDSYLRVGVVYLEKVGRPPKTDVGEADYAVRADTDMNADPEVPLQGQGQMRTGGTETDEAIIRYVAEDAAVGTKVGPPVTAVDDNLDGLTYAFGGTDDQMAAAAPFGIDAATGQITTNRAMSFDETVDSPVDPGGADLYTEIPIVVTSTDPDGQESSIRVNIRVTDVDEPPIFTLTDEPTGATNSANREKIIAENATSGLEIGTYAATDPEGTNVTLTLSGDNGPFDISGGAVTMNSPAPDFENPTDADKNNLYELLVIATDATGMKSEILVTVKISNVPNDETNTAGTVTIFNRQPEVGTRLYLQGASPYVNDADEGVSSVRWQWYYRNIATCPDTVDPATNDPDLAEDPTASGVWQKIDGQIRNSYTPTEARIFEPDDSTTDSVDCLMVRAQYRDNGPQIPNDPNTTNHDESWQYAYGISEFPVQEADTDNEAPQFADGNPGLSGTQIIQKINENVALVETSEINPLFPEVAIADSTNCASTPGELIAANTGTRGTIRISDGTFTDADNNGVIGPCEGTYTADDYTSGGDQRSDHGLTFSKGGTDAGSFRVAKQTGAVDLTVVPNYEAKRRYSFDLIAHDPKNVMTKINVILDVIDINEDPMLATTEVPDGDPIIGGPGAVNYEENSTDMVATYQAFDPEGDPYAWALEGTDASLFSIGTISGRLTFKKAPNYEDPQDSAHSDPAPADDETNNVYVVVVHLLKDGESMAADTSRQKVVRVTVTDVDEAPMFTQTTDDNDNVVPTPLNIDENKQPNVDLNRAVANSPQAMDEDQIPEDPMYSTVALVYTLSGNDAEVFDIVPATGELRTAQVLDYESLSDGAKYYEVTVMATDPTGLDDDIDLLININNVDEAPVGGGTNQAPQFASATMTREVDENTEAGMDIGVRVTATDNDGNTITYTLGGTNADHFDIDEATGQLMTSGALDYESKSSYSVTVTATDDDPTKRLSDVTTVTINVTNVEEDGAVALSSHSPVVGGEVTATLSDPDGGITSLVWTWETSSNGTNWVEATGVATDAGDTSTYVPVEADTGRYLRANATYTDVVASGNSEVSDSAMVVAAGSNVAPEFADETATRSIAENTAANTNIGAPVAATDANNDTLAYTLEGTDAASFGIDSGTGQLSTSAALDYETKRVYTVVVKATDPGELSDTIDVTINVTDVDDGAVTPTDPVDTYDTDGTPGIQIDELIKAIDDYFDGDLNIDDLFEVIDAYFE